MLLLWPVERCLMFVTVNQEDRATCGSFPRDRTIPHGPRTGGRAIIRPCTDLNAQ